MTAPDPSLADQRFRHSGWHHSRERVLSAMFAADLPDNRIRNFMACGTDAFVAESIHEPGRYTVLSCKCRDRFCKPCARERSGRLARNLLDHVGEKELRFVTLTLATQTNDLNAELDRLYSSFAHLRKRTFWKRHVFGGAALLEVKYNEASSRWHPHLHILVEGRYVPHTQLRSEWYHVTGDSLIVDIRAVRRKDKVTRYVTKYAADPIDGAISRRVDLLSEAIIALQGRRSCTTFGTWRTFGMTDGDCAESWKRICSLNELIARAKAGEAEARSILNRLVTFNDAGPKRTPNVPTDPDPPPSFAWFEDDRSPAIPF